MKKIIALLLCALMLFGMAAVAEEGQDTALVSLLHNIVLETGSNGETSTIALDGLELYVSLDTADGLALVLQAFNGDDSLALAVLKLVGTELRFSVDGVDKTFAQDIPALAGQDTASLGETLRPMLPALLNLQLPPINVGSLPKLDLLSLASLIGTEAEDGSVTFSIPHEMIDSLLDQLLESGKSMTGSIPGAGQVLELLEQLRASGMSIALEGTVADAGDQQTASVGILPVSGDQVADSAAAVLNFSTMEDAISLTLDIAAGDDFQTVADLELQTDAASSACSATLDIAGQMQFNLGVFQEDGLQKIALTMDSGFDASFALTLSYGKSGDTNVADLGFSVGEDIALEVSSSTNAVSEDATTGAVEVNAAAQGTQFRLATDVDQFIGSVDLGGYTQPAATESFENISGEENSAALQAALEPLVEYLGQVFANAAA